MLQIIKKILLNFPVIGKFVEVLTLNYLRETVSFKYIKGNGIEIGALHRPLIYSNSIAKVTYVDRLTVDKLKEHYPELSDSDLVDVDVIDDGELLKTFAPESLDFIIANHMLEHCRNPIKTIHTHIEKIKKGGVLYYAIPDKRYTFDKKRALTTIEHLVDDYNEKIDHSQHYREWCRYCEKISDDSEIKRRAEQLLRTGYSIHYHTWTVNSFREFLTKTRNFNTMNSLYEITYFSKNKSEVIAVLTKN
jgi:predicted SAM-dependent methyltransferase